MKNKAALILIFAGLGAGAGDVFGLELPIALSFGGGGTFNTDWTSFDVHGGNNKEVKASSTGIYWGFYGFFTAKYAEATISALLGGTSDNTTNLNGQSVLYSKTSETILELNISGKYPFTSKRIDLFPLLGIDWKIYLSRDVDGKNDMYSAAYNYKSPGAGEFNSLFLKVGGGVDYKITEKWFVRGEITYDFKVFSSASDSKNLEYFENNIIHGDIQEAIPGWQAGPVFKLGLGYKLIPKPARQVDVVY